MRNAFDEDERPVRQVRDEPAPPRPEPLAVELLVQCVGAGLSEHAEHAHVVLAPAQCAGTVARGERSCVVEEEEAGVLPGLRHRRAIPVPELEAARDPAPGRPAPLDLPRGVVQAAAVAVDEAALRHGDELAEGRYTVVEWVRNRPDGPLS